MLIAFRIITHAVHLATIIACVLYWFKKKPIPEYRYFSAGWGMILLYDLVMVAIGLFYPENNNHVYNIAFPLQQLFIMYFFILLSHWNKLLIVMIAFGVFAVLNLLRWQGLVVLNTYTLAVGGIIIVVFAFYKLYSLYSLNTPESIYKDPVFWICTGFIIYWGMGTPFFTMYNFLWKTTPEFFIIYFYTVNFGFTILLNLSVIKALQCSLKV